MPVGGLVKLEPGTTYSTSTFWAPFGLSVEDEGWWWRGMSDTWVYLEWHEPNASLFDLDIAVLAHATRSDPEALIAGFIARDAIDVVRGPVGTTVGGHQGWVVDVVNTDTVRADRFGYSCDTSGRGYSRFDRNGPGETVLTTPGATMDAAVWRFGLAACSPARIWAIDVDGDTIMVIAAAVGVEAFEELVPLAERLLEGFGLGRAP